MATTVENGNTYITYESAGGEATFAIPFPFLQKGHVKVSVNDVVQIQDTDYSVDVGANTISFKVAEYPTGIPAADNVKIWRSTEWLTRLVDFASGSQVTETDLDTSALQLFYIIQELIEDNIAGTVTIDIGPGSGGGGSGTGVGGINVIDYTMPSDSDTVPLGTEGLTKNVLQLYRNGVYVPPSDWEINVDGDTITADYNFLAGDKINVLYLFGSIVTTINTSVVTTASLLDGAVTTSKIADGAVTTDKIADSTILYEDCDPDFDGNWTSLADGNEGVGGMLTDLNDRVDLLEAAVVALQIEKQSFTISPSATSLTKAFSFTPDYVVIYAYNVTDKDKGSSPLLRSNVTNFNPNFIESGTRLIQFRAGLGSGGSGVDIYQDFNATLSGANLTIAVSGIFADNVNASWAFRAIAYKEA